jgi:hypothetical protein
MLAGMPEPSTTQPIEAAFHSPWYAAAMERLVGVVQELSQARSVEAVAGIVREADSPRRADRRHR